MSQRSIRDETLSTAHKRHATAPQDEEGSTLPSSASSSSSLGQASSSSIPKIPLGLIADLILPFVADRATWDSVYCASKELCLAGKKMTPPWPNTRIKWNGRHAIHPVAFSPSGLQLAFVINRINRNVVHVWDRWGKETLLKGHNSATNCLEYSSDGEYLASGSQDGWIRLWHTESFHAAFSKVSREKPARTPEQGGKILLHNDSRPSALAFSRTDSNLLASAGGLSGMIKVWNVEERSCIHSFNPSCSIRSLFFAGGADCLHCCSK
jgi:WD40 repeat protein